MLFRSKVTFVETAIRHDITMTVYTKEVLDEIMDSAQRQQRRACIHLKLETGCERKLRLGRK